MEKKEKKALLIYFDEEEMIIYKKLKELAKKDKRTLPNTAKMIFREKLELKRG